MGHPLTVILADYLTGRISTVEALRLSRCRRMDDLVRAARDEGEEADAAATRRQAPRGGA